MTPFRTLPYLLLLVACSCFGTKLSLPSVFSDHMVLQRDQALPIWGKAAPHSRIAVEFAGQKKITQADDDGNWRVELEPLNASAEPGKLVISTKENAELIQLTFADVLVGEVWLCSGQSNMEWSMLKSENPQAAIAAANHPQIRLFHTPKRPSEKPLDVIDANWKVCTPETAESFSAVAYYFGRKLQQELNVPIGLLQSAWGGTRIEPWTPPSGFEGIDSLKSIHQQVQKTLPGSPAYTKAMDDYLRQINEWSATAHLAAETNSYVSAPPEFPEGLILTGNQQTPTKLYNGMLHAHVPYAIRGAIWYQGESNHSEGMLYVDKTKALLKGWREAWGYEFPYYFVQIAPYQYGKESSDILPIFWEAQAEIVKTIPKTGMAVVSDYTTLNNIHPPNKEIPGTRLALLALANDYGKDIVSTGPVFESLQTQGSELHLHFISAEGLSTRDGKSPDWFEVAGKDGVFTKATAQISDNTVIVHSDAVPEPIAVRFAWHKLATPNLVNTAGLPAATFRAGDLPKVNNPALSQVPEAKGFRVIYQIDVPTDANYGASAPTYTTNNSATDAAPFSQIAYYLELENNDGTKQYVFTSMDRFTEDVKKIAFPTKASGAHFMQKVSNLTVRTNVSGLTSCTNSDGGNIEFWPNNYSTENKGNISGASDSTHDFGDSPSQQNPGYGSMQVHNWKDKQTIFAINNWGNSGGPVDIGIGNAPSGRKDWTFSKNAADYKIRRLTVMVK
ncbi:MAG: sialate O-acetylesterase [Opitutaceae bacterium]